MLYLENAIEHFQSARSNLGYDGPAEYFYHRIARMIPDTVDLDTLILVFKIALSDAEKRGENTLGFIALVPRYIEQFASPEFANEFREKYIFQVLGINKPDLPDVDYGITEVSPHVVDISKKDLGEVIANLYNQACPVGNGFMHYDPSTWDRDYANAYLEHYKDELMDEEGYIYIKYILGRPMYLTIHNNLIYLESYDRDNGAYLGERIIRTIPDKNLRRSL